MTDSLTREQLAAIDAAIQKAKKREQEVSDDDEEGSVDIEPQPPTRRIEEKKQKPKKERDSVPHMSKIKKAESKLPTMDDTVKEVFDSVTTTLTEVDIMVLSKHLEHYVRFKQTERALNVNLEVGQVVRICNGDVDNLGKIGTVMKVQRIRCYVEVPGASKHVYLFTSDVEPVEQSTVEVIDDITDCEPETETELESATG